MVKTVMACKRYIETAGMRLSNGEIIYTDPLNADTDGDGLKDGEEIIPQFKFVNSSSIGLSGVSCGICFNMLSDPTIRDTDGDGLYDKEDPYPKTFNTYIRYNRKTVTDYCDRYYMNPNTSSFAYFESGDCANFVSQCINAGGISMNDDWYFYSEGIKILFWYIYENYSSSWTVAYDNYKYFKENKSISNGQVIEFNSVQDMQNAIKNNEYNIQAGDLMYMQWEYDHPHHATIIDGIDYEKSTLTYSGHTDPRNHDDVIEKFWNNNPNGKLYIIHINEVIITS